MKTATVTFQAGSYMTAERLINSFNALIVSTTGMCFSRVDVIQKAGDVKQPNAVTVILYSQSGYIIKVAGLHPGHDGEKIVKLLHFCEFKMEDATIYSIINREKINVTLWNKKYM